jgi:hypothetical protein
LIFKPQLVDKILKHQKTMTRQPLTPYSAPASPWIVTKGGQRRRRPIPRTVTIRGGVYRDQYRVGQVLPVQKMRGRKAVTHIEIVGLRHERLSAITHHDARGEGFRTTDDFKAHWVALNDAEWLAGMEADGDPLPPPLLTHRFDECHASTRVWVITFVICEAPPEYLRPTSGYTTVRAASLTAQDSTKRAVIDTNDGAVVEDLGEPDGDDRYLRNPPPRAATIARLRPASQGERDALISRLRSSYHGWEPEDVIGDEPRYGSAGDVRAMRREMGLRGTDGLDPIPDDELERVLAFMIFREASLREIMLAMDWSLGKTQRELSKRGRTVETPQWLREEPAKTSYGEGRRAA